MSMSCPTVRVAPTSPEQGDFVVINAADYDPATHVLLEGEVSPIVEDEPGDEHDIPADWQALHWTKRVKMAKALSGGDVADAAAADEIIAGEVSRRATAEASGQADG